MFSPSQVRKALVGIHISVVSSQRVVARFGNAVSSKALVGPVIDLGLFDMGLSGQFTPINQILKKPRLQIKSSVLRKKCRR